MATQISRLRFGKFRIALSQANGTGSWYFCVYIEGKQYRKSLKTAVLDEAKEAAQAIMIDLLAKQKSGQKIFSVTLGELRRAFLLHLDKTVAQGTKSEGTIRNTVRRIDQGMRYLASKKISPNAAVDGVSADLWKGYIDWRLTEKAGMRRDVINQELMSIRSLFKFAKDQRWITDASIPVWEIQVEKEAAKRRRVTAKEIRASITAISEWAAAAKSEKDKWQRMMLLTVCQVMEHSGMRIGEVVQLKNSDVEINGTEVTINIRAETSKVRTSRQVTILHSAALYLVRWRQQFQKFKGPNEFIFGEEEGKDGDHPFQTTLKRLRAANVIAADFDPYHFRHGFITTQILKGAPLHLIAKFCGTSDRMISQTYSHVITGMLGRQFAKTKLVYDQDGTFSVVERE